MCQLINSYIITLVISYTRLINACLCWDQLNTYSKLVKRLSNEIFFLHSFYARRYSLITGGTLDVYQDLLSKLIAIFELLSSC